MTTLTCPGCSNTDGSSIMGVEVRGVYDGTLYWVCLSCNLAWSRDWTGYGSRGQVAADHVARHNLIRRPEAEHDREIEEEER